MNDMNEKYYDNDGIEISKSNHEIPVPPSPPESPHPPLPPLPPPGAGLNDLQIFEQIKAITADNAHIGDALRSLERIDTVGAQLNDGYGVQGKSEAIANVVRAREETNRQMLGMLEKMYDNNHKGEIPDIAKQIAGQKNDVELMETKMKHFQTICESLAEFTDHTGNLKDEVMDIVKGLTEKIFI